MIKRVAFIASSSDMSSGANWSLVKLVVNLRDKLDQIIVIIPEHGALEEHLKKERIKYYLVPQNNINCWYSLIDQKNDFMTFFKYIFKLLLNRRAIHSIVTILKTNHIQLVHMNTLTSYAGAVAANKLKLRLVWHIREFMEEDIGIKFTRPQKAIALLNTSVRVICISKAVAEKYTRIINVPVDVVYNGVNENDYYTSRGILDNKLISVLISGRITPSKGQYELLQALNSLPTEIQDRIECKIVGKVENKAYAERLNNFIKDTNLKHVEVIGPTDNIKKYLKQSDIICVCSKREAFGRATVEGMLSGALVIGSNSGGTREIIKDMQTGLLYNTGDPNSLADRIEWVFSNKKSAAIIARAGQLDALARFTDVNNAKEIYQRYLTLTN